MIAAVSHRSTWPLRALAVIMPQHMSHLIPTSKHKPRRGHVKFVKFLIAKNIDLNKAHEIISMATQAKTRGIFASHLAQIASYAR